MTPEDRKVLAESLMANPLTEVILSEIERLSVEDLITAQTEQARVEAQWRVRSARSFRRAFENAARSGGTEPGSFA